MRLAFTKMHGLGNDFIVFDAPRPRRSPVRPSELRRLADRRTGIGFDQALVLEPPAAPGTDVYYRIFNADGAEVEQCGNGARCIARSSRAARGAASGPCGWTARAASSRPCLRDDGLVSVAMGVPDFDPRSLPFEAPSAKRPAIASTCRAGPVEFGAVSIGNPHAVIRVPRCRATRRWTPSDPPWRITRVFRGASTWDFSRSSRRTHVRLRVFERGVGETLACGTGACAAVGDRATARPARRGGAAWTCRADD